MTANASGAATAPSRRLPDWQEHLVLCVVVGLGAALGSVLRALVSLGTMMLVVDGPWGTLLVNVVGSLVIGCYATVTGPGGRWAVGNRQQQFVMTGVCGGFTTFSLFSLETLQLALAGAWHLAAGNVALSVPLWLSGVWLGHRLALLVIARPRV